MKKNLALFASALLAALLANPVAAAPITQSMSVDILYNPTCTIPQILNLGTLTVTLEDNVLRPDGSRRPVMEAVFTTSAAARASGIWDCMRLHFLQEITQDSCPLRYGGVEVPRAGHSIIDPPSGGYDGQPFDTLPWYDPDAQSTFVLCESYQMLDAPTYCPGAGTTSFTTFLVAESFATCPLPDCLHEDEILLLKGFDWVTRRPAADGTGGSTLSMIRAPLAGDVASFQDALAEANFTRWTVVRDRAICCPEPGACVLLGFGAVLLAPWLRRSVRRAA